MNRKNNTLEGIGAFTVIILAIFTLVISPALSFMFAYIGGCILKFFVGDALVNYYIYRFVNCVINNIYLYTWN